MSKQAYSPKRSKTVLNELRLEKCCCDAVIKVDDVEFPVHKVILCSSSPYFRAMIQSCANKSERYFKICGVSPEIMELMLEWIYTGFIILTEENVQDLVRGADMLLIEDLVELCFNYMEDNMCPENCIGIWKFADFVVSKSISVRENAQRYILSHFEEVMVCDQFQELTAEELVSLIENDELNVKSENVVYAAILHWTNHAPRARSADFAKLFAKVRLTELSPDCIQTVRSNTLVQDNPECITAIAHSVQAVYETVMNRMPLFSSPLFRPRLPGAILLAIGGWCGHRPTNAIEAYDYKVNHWVNFTNHLEQPRAYHGVVFFNRSVYYVGGFDHVEHFNSMCRLDLSTRTWHEMPNMYHRRCYVSVTMLNGCIYAIGGFNGHTRLSTAEVYNPETNQWSLIAPMHEERSDANCAALDGKIYVCGGFNGSECHQTAECYDPETNQWMMIAPMTTRRSGVGVIAYTNHIYAVGGHDGNVRLRSIEAYNPRTDSWHQVASMISPRSNFGIEVVDDRIFAVGGFNGFTTTNSVESYDPVNDTWSQAHDMNIVRSAVNCCVISGLPNMAEFTVSRNALALLDVDDAEEVI